MDDKIKIKDLNPITQGDFKESAEFPITQDGETYKASISQVIQKVSDKQDDKYFKKTDKIPNENLTFGEVKEGDKNVVSGVNVYNNLLLKWKSIEQGLEYPVVRTYRNNAYQVIEGKVSTGVNPKDDVENWELFNYTPSNGLAVDSSAKINLNTENDTLEFKDTFAVIYNRNRISLSENQTLDLITSQPAVLYISKDGVIGTTGTSSISSIDTSSVVFATYRKITPQYYGVNGLVNYSIDDRHISINKNINYATINGGGYLNFDLVNNKLMCRSTNVLIGSDGGRLAVSPQSQDVDISESSGIYIIYFDNKSTLNTILQSRASNIPENSYIVGSYTRIEKNMVKVSGVDNYKINGVDSSYIDKGIGKLVSYDGYININNRTLEIKGTTFLTIGRVRYSIPISNLEFSSSSSVFYYSPRLNAIGSTLSSKIDMPADAIIFGGHIGAHKGSEFEIWGIDNYSINGYNKNFWSFKRIQKKLFVDFDPTQHYYKCDTDVSMTDTDPEPLIGSDPAIMKEKYEELMLKFPSLFKKEEIATIPTKFGDRTIDVFTFTPPTIEATRPDKSLVSITQPHVFVNCSIHGNEKTSSMACYLFLKDVLERWQYCKVLEFFRFNVKLSIIPTANPSGWALGIRQNTNLVDLNRNFPYQYIPNYTPGGTTYSGKEALDQPESKAINDWINENKEDLLLGIDFHNFFGGDNDKPNLGWTEGVTPLTCNLGRVAAQRVSRGSRKSSVFFPENHDEMLMTASYPTSAVGRLSGQMNYMLPYGLTFEVSQNFKYNPEWKANDNNALRLSTECFGNSLATFVKLCIEDYNSKYMLYS